MTDLSLTPDEKREEEGLEALNILLDRQIEVEYQQEWKNTLSLRSQGIQKKKSHSLFLFHIKGVLLGISAKIVKQVSHIKPSHRIPHNQKKALHGVINNDGQLKVLVNLYELLQIHHEEPEKQYPDESSSQKLLVLDNGRQNFCAIVDEILGIHHLEVSQLENLPTTVSKSDANVFESICRWKEGKKLAIIDSELLFANFKKILP